MIKIRRAQKKDYSRINNLLNELDLGHPSFCFENIYVAVEAGKVTGIVNLEEFGEVVYLSAIGVDSGQRFRGIARTLIDSTLGRMKKDVYLYTKIPEFFSGFGFVRVSPHAKIPRREIYDCGECRDASRCICMARKV